MLMESQVKFPSSPKHFWSFAVNRVVAFSLTVEVVGDLFYNGKNNQKKKKNTPSNGSI